MKRNVTEREVNLIDMFWASCLKWRQILVWAVVFAVLAGGISYLKSVQMVKDSLKPAEEVVLDEIELESDSENIVNVYLQYKQMYADQILYNKMAPLMQLNANGFYRSIVTYYVDNPFEAQSELMDENDTTEAIIDAYEARLQSEEFTKKLMELTNCDEKAVSYKKELIDCTNEYGQNDTDIKENGIMMISIYGDEEQNCKELVQLVKETIDSEKGAISKLVGEHDISLIEDSCNYVVDVKLLKYQQENISKLSVYATNIGSIKNQLTNDELSYVDFYEKKQAEVENGETEGSDTVIPKATISKKLIAVGFVLGAAFAFFVAILMYLSNSRLRLEDDFETIYGVKLLGNVVVKNEDKKRWFSFIDRFLNKMRHLNKHYFTENEAVSMVAAGIRIGAKKSGTTRVYITGAVMGKEEKTVIERLKKELKQTDIEVLFGKPILYDAEALEQSADIGYVVLVERVGGSLYGEVAEEVEMCIHQGVKVLGAVVVA